MSLASAEAKLFETPVSSRLARSKTIRRSILLLTLTLLSAPAIAQVTLGTSPLSIAKGGTGGATASAARTSLGLGSISTQNANAVAITGGSVTGLPTPSSPSDAATKSYADGLAGVSSFNGRTGAVVPANGDYNAGQITYTPQGTGGVPTNVQTEVQRYGVWANDFGALCNGGGNDLTAFQNAINEAQTLAVPMKFTGAACVVSGTLNITTTIDMSAQFENATLYESNLAVNLLIVSTTLPVYLHDFNMNYTATGGAGTTAITVTVPSTGENGGSVFERLHIGNFAQVGINFLKSSGFRLVNSVVVGLSDAVIVANGNLADSGDSTISGNQFQAGAGGSAIVYNSSGGLRFINNKINGSNISNGFQMALTNGATTADLFIIGNSIEGISLTGGNGIFLARAGTTGGFGTIIITGNELSGNVGLDVPTDANGVWINNLVVTSNICVTCNLAGISVDSAQGIVIANNFIQPNVATTVPIAMGTHGPTATNCVVGPNPHLGTAAASATGACTVIAPN